VTRISDNVLGKNWLYWVAVPWTESMYGTTWSTSVAGSLIAMSKEQCEDNWGRRLLVFVSLVAQARVQCEDNGGRCFDLDRGNIS
jgi:hypothetical protein